jgi:hypothetical protein
LPNEFDPDRKTDNLSIDFKDTVEYEYQALRDDELSKLEDFDEWIRNQKK